MSTLGKRIKSIRLSLGYNQKDFADQFGYGNNQVVSSWESDKSDPPLKVIKEIARLGGVTVDWLLLGDSPNVVATSIPAEETLKSEMNNDVLELIGQRIRKIRKDLGMNQTEFAHFLGMEIKQTTISTWEKHSRGISVSILKHIADKCNVTIAWFTEKDNDQFKKIDQPGETLEAEQRFQVDKDDWMAFKRVLKILKKLG